jgi:hypothetical protein
MCDLAVSHYSTRAKDPGSYCLARIGVCAGSPPPALPLGRRWLAANRSGAHRQLRGLSDYLAHRYFGHPASGSIHGCGIRFLRVLGIIRARERILVPTTTLGEGCLCDRSSWNRHWWVNGRASWSEFTPFRSRWIGYIHGRVANRGGCLARSRSAVKAQQRWVAFGQKMKATALILSERVWRMPRIEAADIRRLQPLPAPTP